MAERMVKVRIAVAVDGTGTWVAAGWPTSQEKASGFLLAHDYVSELADHIAYHWVTAELPIPAETEVEGEVEDA